MLLIDNIYYIFCCLYRKTKESRIEDSWRFAGGTITVLYLGFSLWLFLTPLLDDDHDIGFYQMAAVFVIVILIVTIRYTKYQPFDKLEEKMKKMNQRKKRNIDICTYLFLLACLPIAIAYAYYLK